ncbi:MAG: NAD(P)/FAD-dependent oxidoreductase, partial [Gammaproteobacteria bacterium]|nr:NAD(P)/FAD-dependent oxidoreductase [Gammaproteobacteria bacterium]
HQPSAFYGVNSRGLGSGTIDQTGWNKGLYELATNSEVCAYFDQVMQQQFLPSGQVRYFPMCEYQEGGRFVSLVSNAGYQVQANKVVDATYMHVAVPSMGDPSYAVSSEAECVPPNQLPRVSGQFQRYVVVGAGKTGMDACLWLLKNEVDPAAITWIMPRDSWLLDRATIQPGTASSRNSALGFFAQQVTAIVEADSIDDLFERLDACGNLLRLDKNINPTMYRCATVTKLELEQLRRIDHIVRLGRVQSIDADRIVLDEGTIPTDASTLHVDCSADGLERRPAVEVFENGKITLQSLRTCQQVFSAAFIGHIEAAYEDEAMKNQLCTPVPHPDSNIDWLNTTLTNSLNQAKWLQDEGLRKWLLASRLDGFRGLLAAMTTADPDTQAAVRTMGENTLHSIVKLQSFLAELDPG